MRERVSLKTSVSTMLMTHTHTDTDTHTEGKMECKWSDNGEKVVEP